MTNTSLLASAWIRQREMLMVVANRGDTDAETRLHMRSLHGRVVNASDAVTNQPLDKRARDVSLTVPKRGFRLIRLSLAGRRAH